jgi:hypothetical protein
VKKLVISLLVVASIVGIFVSAPKANAGYDGYRGGYRGPVVYGPGYAGPVYGPGYYRRPGLGLNIGL